MPTKGKLTTLATGMIPPVGVDKKTLTLIEGEYHLRIKPLRNRVTTLKERVMAEPCCRCGTTTVHPFEGLVRGITDGESYHVYCKPPLQSLHCECETCEWHLMHGVIPAYCPRCGRPTRVLLLEEQ